jgi:RNA recognition motif-containing protein
LRPPDAASWHESATSSFTQRSGAVAPAIYIIVIAEDFLLTKLYVGNLPFSATEDSVRELFAAHGAVEKVALVNDRDTGQPRGFGFVEMSSADAQKAMQSLNGKDFGGRPLKVNEAQDKPRGGGGGGGGGGYGRR